MAPADLIPEEITLLRWLSQQPDLVTIGDMHEARAIGFTPQRVQQLIERGHIGKTLGVTSEDIPMWYYYITDDGNAALSRHDERERIEQEDRSISKAQAAKQTWYSKWQTIFSGAAILISLGSVLYTHYTQTEHKDFAKQIDHLQITLNETVQQVDATNQRISELSDEISSQNQESTDARQALDALLQEVASIQQGLTEAQQEISQLSQISSVSQQNTP